CLDFGDQTLHAPRMLPCGEQPQTAATGPVPNSRNIPVERCKRLLNMLLLCGARSRHPSEAEGGSPHNALNTL
ncbi:hypothetical protein P7K49_027928, partial [Saguinus oedipus]